MSKSDEKYQSIASKCVGCNKCYESCIMLQELGESFTDILENEKLGKGKNLCSVCGLCTEVCPLDLDISGYYKNLKQEKTNKILLKYLEFLHRRMVEKSNG